MFLIWPRSYFESSVAAHHMAPPLPVSCFLTGWIAGRGHLMSFSYFFKVYLSHDWIDSVSTRFYCFSITQQRFGSGLWEQPDDWIFSYLKIHLIRRSSVLHFGAWIICFLVRLVSLCSTASLSQSLIWCEIFTKYEHDVFIKMNTGAKFPLLSLSFWASSCSLTSCCAMKHADSM